MRLGILGPLLVVDDAEREILVAANRQRTLLVALLVHANRVVPMDELVEIAWDGRAPAGAARTLRSYFVRLRHAVGPAVAARIVTRYPGYLCQAADDELDLLRFDALCDLGATAVRDRSWIRARELLAEALGLWRGLPLADISSQLLRAQCVPRLEQARLQALEGRIEADLHLGRHDVLVSELQALVQDHPLRERGHAQLMLALYRCGRTAEALNAFQGARRLLVGELGVEPGPELQDLQAKILGGDLALAAPRSPAPSPVSPQRGDGASPAVGGASDAVPRQLPATVSQFTGREAELARLSGLLAGTGEGRRQTMVISAIGGSPGVGKTALAVHFAHRVAGLFPDGQLYVNLRGFDTREPVSAADALAGFLHALGVVGRDVPPDEHERAAKYRSLLAARRMLVMLDNARDAEHVRPLLPGGADCLALVTSRDSLAGLVARDGAVRIELDVLAPGDALALLRALIGARARAEPAAAAALAEACCRLPLALRVAAELAVARPTVTLAALVDELGDHRRLDLLGAGGDDATAVRAVFSWSYRYLDAQTARAFRLLALHPGADLELHAAAALLGIGQPDARRLLDRLTRAHLTQAVGADRYTMHDLLRAYARELAALEDSAENRQAALTGLYDYYLAAAGVADDTLYPLEPHLRPEPPPPVSKAPALADPSAALAWLNAERANLLAVARHAAETDWPGHAARLSPILFRYLYSESHLSEAAVIHDCARRAAARTGDRAAEANALRALGGIDFRQGRYSQAVDCFRRALALYREVDDHIGQARALHNLGLIDEHQGRYPRAAEYDRQALALGRAVGDQLLEASTLCRIGVVSLYQGSYRQAIDYLQQAVALYRARRIQRGERDVFTTSGEADALTCLALVDMHQGRYDQSADLNRQALALYRSIGACSGENDALTHLATVERCQGRHAAAAEHLHRAVALCRAVDDRRCEAEATSQLGLIHLHHGEHQQATDHQQRALALYRELGDRHGEGQVLARLGLAELAAGQPRQSLEHLAHALRLSREIGALPLETYVLNGLGQAMLAAGHPERTCANHTAALKLSAQIGEPAEQARAHHGLARAHTTLGDQRRARHHMREALTLYAALVVP